MYITKPRGLPYSDVSSKLISRYQRHDLKDMREAFKPLVERIIEQPIRRVITYNERIQYGGFCNTCSYEETIVEVFFKSWGGRMCCLVITGSFTEVTRSLVKASEAQK